MRRLPMGVTHIKTIFRYENTKDKRKGKHPNIFSHNKRNKRNVKEKKIEKDCCMRTKMSQ